MGLLAATGASLAMAQIGGRLAPTAAGQRISVNDYGARGDGNSDDTAAIKAASEALVSGGTLVFPKGEYLISQACAGHQTKYGRKVMFLSGKTDIVIVGEGATIKCRNHAIASHGGLVFLWVESSQRITVEGLAFDMTFVGCNKSAAAYPFCGAIIISDGAPTGARTERQLSSHITVRNCSFKLYNPLGSYVTTNNPHNGDPNNGYKLYSIFAGGDHLATLPANQNNDIRVESCTWKRGHNGYGAWVWAFNTVRFERLVAESWVTKNSDTSGAVKGGGVPFVRYHQWHCSDVWVTKCNFVAKPCNERMQSGLEGEGTFCHLTTNLKGNYRHGRAIVRENKVALGNGDGANKIGDYGVLITIFGDVVISENVFEGEPSAVNALGGSCVLYAAESFGGDGAGTLTVSKNTFGAGGRYNQNIVIANGSTISAEKRRCKSITVRENISHAQLRNFLDLTANSTAPHVGCSDVLIENNTVIGAKNPIVSSSDIKSVVLRLAASASGDRIVVRGNTVRDRHTFADVSRVNTGATAVFDNNKLEAVAVDLAGRPASR